MESEFDKLIKIVESNLEEAQEVFEKYYNESAQEQGEGMMYDEQYYGEDSVEYEGQEIELYEQFAHCTGHAAHYEGAIGVIKHFMTDDMDPDLPNYEDLQLDIVDVLDQNF